MFIKLICNLLLEVHPICTNKWSHAISTKSIYNYYLNIHTIFTEYQDIDAGYHPDHNGIEDINESLSFAVLITRKSIIIKWLLKNGADVHYDTDYALLTSIKHSFYKTKNKTSPSMYDSDGNIIRIIKILLEAGADVHAENNESLIEACKGGYLIIVKLLLAAGADIHARNNQALIDASANGHFHIVNILLKKGADVHAQDDQALISAVRRGRPEIVKLLLAKGANIHAQNGKAINMSMNNVHVKIAKILGTKF